MSSIVIIATLDLSTQWEFDAVADAGRKTTTETPKHPVESGALIANHVVDASDDLKCSGVITFTPAVGVPGIGRAETLVDKLRALQSAHQPVWWLGPAYSGQALLKEVDAYYSTTDGQAFKVSVTASRFADVTASTTTMPPSRLRAAVKPGSAAKAAGTSKKKARSLAHNGAYRR